MDWITHGEVIIPGRATGIALVSSEPLSFWGGYDHHSGRIIDQRHPLAGELAGDRILAVPFSRGSSTTTAVLLEAIRAGTAPAAILTTGVDTFFALAAVVADVLYAQNFPLLSLPADDFARLRTGDVVTIAANGRITCVACLT